MPTPPTISSVTASDWAASGATKTTASVSWLTGDKILVVGGTSNSNATITDVSNTGGLSLAADTPASGASNCWANTWTATAANAGSGTFTSTISDAGYQHGITVYVVHNSDGLGARATATGAGKTVSLTRAHDNSGVIEVLLDFDAGGTGGLTWTPTGQTQRMALVVGGAYTVYLADWGDQGLAGATSYGISGTTSTGNHARVAVEVQGVTTSFWTYGYDVRIGG